ELTTDGPEIVALQHRAADVARAQIGDPAKAAGLYEAILESEPSDERAATHLRALYAETKREKDLARLLGQLIDVAPTPGARTELRIELARLQFEKFDSGLLAIDTLR